MFCLTSKRGLMHCAYPEGNVWIFSCVFMCSCMLHITSAIYYLYYNHIRIANNSIYPIQSTSCRVWCTTYQKYAPLRISNLVNFLKLTMCFIFNRKCVLIILFIKRINYWWLIKIILLALKWNIIETYCIYVDLWVCVLRIFLIIIFVNSHLIS